MTKKVTTYTTADYEQWECRWKLIGIAIAMSPMPSQRYQNIAGKVLRKLDEAIEKNGCEECVVYQPKDYKISTTTVLNPDVLVVCQPIKGQYLEFAPELVVEILSPSAALKDRNTKYDLYQAERVNYYILIDPTEKHPSILLNCVR